MDVGTSILLEAELLDNIGFRTHEAEGKEDELGREELLRSWDFLHLPAATAILRPLDAN